MAVERLRDAIEEYRSIHHTRCIPSRFQKDIVKVAKDFNSEEDNRIAVEGMFRLISNIGMEHKVSYQDLKTIFQEVGDTPQDKTIPADRLMKMIV